MLRLLILCRLLHCFSSHPLSFPLPSLSLMSGCTRRATCCSCCSKVAPQARQCHLHSGLSSWFYYTPPHKAALGDDDTPDTYWKCLVSRRLERSGQWQVVICRPCCCLWAVRVFEPQGQSCCGGTVICGRPQSEQK